MPDSPDEGKPKRKSDEDLLTEMRTNYQKDADADSSNRKLAMQDLRFVNIPGEQWDAAIRKERGEDRPMYTYNKLRITIKRVINDIRANRPSGKVRATEDGDTDKAEIREGLIRNVLSDCDFDTVLDTAVEFQVTAGMGAMRVNTVLPDDEVYNQDIVVETIRNPFCLYADRHCQDVMKRDARHWVLTSMVGFDAFEDTYGKKVEKTSFQSVGIADADRWISDDSVRICEYWYREPVKRKLLLLNDGKTIDAAKITPAQFEVIKATIVEDREVDSFDIYSCIASGIEILKPPTKWAGTKFPFVVIYGEYIVIDGHPYWFGLTRHSKDAQTAYNFAQTAVFENIALSPQAKWWATPEQAKGLQESWSVAHKKNLPVMFYNHDPKSPGPPQRMGGAEVPAALIELSQMASEDIKATSGIFDNSLGKTANETSGIAIRARQQQGEIATFNFSDNATKGVNLVWELVGDLISNVYDGARTARVLGQDGTEKFHKLNETIIDPETGQEVILNDMSEGKYDYTVTSGPSFATQRQEAAETYTNIAQTNPQIFPLIGDLIMKATDLPYADEISTRLKAMLPPQLQEQADGKPLPPEAMQAMQQAAQAMQQVQQMTQALQQAQDEVNQASEETKKQMSDLLIKRAEVEAEFQKQITAITQKSAALAIAEAQAGEAAKQLIDAAAADEGAQQAQSEQAHAALSNEIAKGMFEVKQMAADYMQQIAATLAQLQVNQSAPAASPSTSRAVRVKRVNGELVGQIDDIPQGVQPQ